MGSYLFERNTEDGAGRVAGASLHDDVERALRELDWIDEVMLQASEGDGSVVTADVLFDPDWPDTANPDVVAEVMHKYGLRIVDNPALKGVKVTAADPLRVGVAAGDDDGLDLFVFDE
jgi:hypothetical protein